MSHTLPHTSFHPLPVVFSLTTLIVTHYFPTSHSSLSLSHTVHTPASSISFSRLHTLSSHTSRSAILHILDCYQASLSHSSMIPLSFVLFLVKRTTDPISRLSLHISAYETTSVSLLPPQDHPSGFFVAAPPPTPPGLT
jgi:hypothetical protein